MIRFPAGVCAPVGRIGPWEELMKIDVGRVIGAVTREVGSREHEGRLARVVVVSRAYETTIDDLWDAVTNAERIPRWFTPVSGELRLGGRYQLQGNAGGTVTSCDPPRSFALTWEFGGNVSWVTVRLTEQGTMTNLELEHLAHHDEHWEKFGPGAAGVGWDMAFTGLGEHLAGAPRVNPEEAMQWMTSAEGHAFIEQSSTDWARAAIAAGTPEDEARAADKRTRAAYTGSE